MFLFVTNFTIPFGLHQQPWTSLTKQHWWRLYSVLMSSFWPEELKTLSRQFILSDQRANIIHKPMNGRLRPTHRPTAKASLLKECRPQPSQSSELKKQIFHGADDGPNELSRVLCKCPCTHCNTLWLMYVRRSWAVPKCPACKSAI